MQIQTDPPIDGELLCEVCGYCACDLFGYYRKDIIPHWRWFCANHRPGKFYADKRIKRLPDPDGEGVGQ